MLRREHRTFVIESNKPVPSRRGQVGDGLTRTYFAGT